MLRRGFVCQTVKIGTFVGNSNVLQAVVQILEPLVVAGVKAVFSEHLEFALGYLFGLLQLHWVQLHRVALSIILPLIVTLHGLLIILIPQTLASLSCLLVRLLLCGAALLLLGTVLLGNFIFHDVDGASLKFLPNLLLLPLPSVFNPLAAITLVFTDYFVLLFSVELWNELQVEKGVVQDFEVLQFL